MEVNCLSGGQDQRQGDLVTTVSEPLCPRISWKSDLQTPGLAESWSFCKHCKCAIKYNLRRVAGVLLDRVWGFPKGLRGLPSPICGFPKTAEGDWPQSGPSPENST